MNYPLHDLSEQSLLEAIEANTREFLLVQPRSSQRLSSLSSRSGLTHTQANRTRELLSEPLPKSMEVISKSQQYAAFHHKVCPR